MMKWLTRISYLYLTLPFMIFCMGWLRLSIAIPAVVIIGWVLWQLLKQSPFNQFPTAYPQGIPESRFPVYLLLITGIWLFLSGIGGYAFQNWDHHWRNAVLRDLITYDWPVIYSTPEHGPIKMLVYYVGYWLPSALVGKLLGWQAANFFLLLWTWLGVLLVTLQLSHKLKTAPLKIILLLIFFSGMDALGTLILAPDYPRLFPPIQHLEIWSGNLQYSSFTTQLFWVFNQAVPAWLCIALILESESSLSESQPQVAGLQSMLAQKIFIWSLCFFFAPLASIGLLIYLSIDWLEQVREIIKNRFKGIRFDLLFASLLIVLISYLFFSSNTAAQERGFQGLALKDALVFFLLEGGILWLFIAPRLFRDPRWIVTGILLLVIPFIQLGSGSDFVMRVSIAPLFYLMIMVAETIFKNTTPRILRFTLYALLFLGALTPLYEINRSIHRTYQYYFVLDEEQRLAAPLQPFDQTQGRPATHLEQAAAPELEHPNSLSADEIITLQFMDDQLSKNFIANVRQSLYYRYISPR